MKGQGAGVGGGVRRSNEWEVGDLLWMEGKIWRVGLVTDSRMRLDPISGILHRVLDHEFETYGNSKNVSPGSVLDRATVGQLTAHQRTRLGNLVKRETEETMADETPTQAAPTPKPAAAAPTAKPVTGTIKPVVKAAPAPAVQPTVSDNKKKNADRIAALKAKKAEAAPEKKSPVEKKPKVTRPCCCGCDAMVTGYFAQGHDARFKGWLLKIERGQMAVKDLPKKVQNAYEWVKKGEGMMPTKNYKGEAHHGYGTEDDDK